MKDTEKALKEELSRNFIGHGQRLTMMSKLVLAILKMCTVNFAQLALVLNRAPSKSQAVLNSNRWL